MVTKPAACVCLGLQRIDPLAVDIWGVTYPEVTVMLCVSIYAHSSVG